MAKTTKIEQRTKDFIAALEVLEKKGKLPSNTELIKVMGLNHSSSISEIRGQRQNIQPDAWKKFEDHYRSEYSESNLAGDDEPKYQKVEKPDKLERILQQQLELLKRIDENIRNVDHTVLDSREHILSTESLSRTLLLHSAEMEQRHFGGDYDKILKELNEASAATYKTLRQLSSGGHKNKVA